MPLDTETRALLDRSAAAPLDLVRMSPRQARAAARAGIFPVQADDDLSVRSLVVDGDERRVPLRLYTPASPAPRPCLVYFHGGGWMIGDLDTVDHLCRALARGAGCAVASVDYRLAPEHPYPAGLDDAFTATAWIAANAAALELDPDRIAVGGDSAGGNLAAAVCLRARDSGGPSVCFQLLAYPITDRSMSTESYSANADGYLLTRDMMRIFWEAYLRDERDAAHPYVSPLHADGRDLPPALILTAEFDPLRDEGEDYGAHLLAAGNLVETVRFEGTVHGFLVRFPILSVGRRALDTCIDALERAFARP